jgi:predicted cupin superfamily sugar epimerase
MWHFYAGGALDVFMISPDGQLDIIHLGNNPDEGQVFQAVVPAGYWFASKPQKDSAYSLVGCTVAPGFDLGFELAERASLQAIFPQHHHLIESLTR